MQKSHKAYCASNNSKNNQLAVIWVFGYYDDYAYKLHGEDPLCFIQRSFISSQSIITTTDVYLEIWAALISALKWVQSFTDSFVQMISWCFWFMSLELFHSSVITVYYNKVSHEPVELVSSFLLHYYHFTSIIMKNKVFLEFLWLHSTVMQLFSTNPIPLFFFCSHVSGFCLHFGFWGHIKETLLYASFCFFFIFLNLWESDSVNIT